MRWLVGGTLIAGMLAFGATGCAELRIDPARGQRQPVVESYDATIDEDAAIPEGPPDPIPHPIPHWAEDDVPPPAFPPPPVD